jgi:hypothetical protein
VWRPIQGPVRSTPLAVCDARSIERKDFVPADLKHEVFMVAHSDSHRWFYFARMQTDEVLLIKCFDSVEDGRHASPPMPRSRIQRRRPTRRLGKASKLASWRFSENSVETSTSKRFTTGQVALSMVEIHE